VLVTVYKDQKKGSLADRLQTGAKHTKQAGTTGQKEDKGLFQV